MKTSEIRALLKIDGVDELLAAIAAVEEAAAQLRSAMDAVAAVELKMRIDDEAPEA